MTTPTACVRISVCARKTKHTVRACCCRYAYLGEFSQARTVGIKTHYPWCRAGRKCTGYGTFHTKEWEGVGALAGYRQRHWRRHHAIPAAERVVLIVRSPRKAIPSLFNWQHAFHNKNKARQHQLQADERDWIKYRDGNATQEIQLWNEHTRSVQAAPNRTGGPCVAPHACAQPRMHACARAHNHRRHTHHCHVCARHRRCAPNLVAPCANLASTE